MKRNFFQAFKEDYMQPGIRKICIVDLKQLFVTIKYFPPYFNFSKILHLCKFLVFVSLFAKFVRFVDFLKMETFITKRFFNHCTIFHNFSISKHLTLQAFDIEFSSQRTRGDAFAVFKIFVPI